VVSEGLGMPAKAAIAAGLAVAAAAGVVFALTGDDAEQQAGAQPVPGVVAPVRPVPGSAAPPAPEVGPPEAETRVAEVPVPPRRRAAAPSRTPAAKRPASPSPAPSPSKPPAASRPPKPAPKPPQGYQLARLEHSVYGEHAGPELETWRSSWVWQRWGLVVGGQQFGQGITVNSRSSVEISLNRQCSAFSARVGVDRTTLIADGEVRFSVYGDGRRLWQSHPLGYDDAPVGVEVPLAGTTTLRLVVERAGQGRLPALASWADAVVGCG
ncbi:NPCBM/NEW2 domain-containing protein, partial [Streptomyces sp. NPDC054838]